MNQTEDRIQGINDEKEVSFIIYDQINALHDLAAKFNHSTEKAHNAVKQAEDAKQKSTKLGNRKEAIESLQAAMSDLAEAMQTSSDSQKCTLEYLQQMSNIIRYLFQLGLTDIAMNRSVIHQLEEMMTGASQQKIDDTVQREINSVLIQLKARQDMMQKQSDLNVKMKKLNIARKNLEASINSVDNFNMLITEIDQGVYTAGNALLSICNVLSQLDRRILCDSRKLEIIRRSLEKQNILNDTKMLLREYLTDILCAPAEELGEILELGMIRNNCVADTTLTVVDTYFSMEIMEREAKSVPVWIRDVIKEKGLSDTISFSTNEIYNDFISGKIHVMEELSAKDESVYNQSQNAEGLKGTEEDLFQDDLQSQEEREAEKLEEERKLLEAEQLYFDCKLDEAFESFCLLAEKGNGRAMYFLGEYYDHQYGHVPKDSKESRKWRMKGYEARDSLAALNACRYLEDDSAERKQVLENVAQSVYHLAKSGDVYAQNELSDMYFYGHGIEKNEKEGWNWLKKSAEEGYWRAIYKMGELYRNGTYIVKDKKKKKKWYKKGMEKGDAYSYLGMARCTIGNYHFLFGRDQMSLDVLLGLKRIDSIRFELQGKLEKVMKEVLDFCLESYKRGCGEAAFMSAMMYDSFVNVLFGNFEYDKAFLWAGKAAEMGCEEGLFYLGYCYYWGRGTDQNYQLAQKYYKLASEQGYNDATIMLGIMALENQNDADAKRWFYLAKKNGSVVSNAVKLLCEIFKRKHKESVFKYSSKLKDTLNIKNNDRIYLSHDDSGLKNGKYGFIIAESGIYSKDFEFLLSVPANYVSYDKLAKYSGIRVEDNNCTVYADDKFLSYFSGGDKERLDVIELMRNIKLIANTYKE